MLATCMYPHLRLLQTLWMNCLRCCLRSFESRTRGRRMNPSFITEYFPLPFWVIFWAPANLACKKHFYYFLGVGKIFYLCYRIFFLPTFFSFSKNFIQFLLHMTKSMCIAVQLRKFFFHNSQLHNKRLLEKSQNPREIRTCSLPIARHKC